MFSERPEWYPFNVKYRETPQNYHGRLKQERYFSYPSSPLKREEEQPIFFNDNSSHLRAYENYIKSKSQAIDNNAESYLNFLSNKKRDNLNRRYITQNFISTDFTPFQIKSRQSDITDPNYFDRGSYNALQQKRKEYLNYNYISSEAAYKQKKNKFVNDEILDINPYNGLHRNVLTLGNSTLEHNPILNPVNNYEYNHYLNRKFNKY